MDFNTLSVHGGAMKDENAGAVVNPIYLSTTFERGPSGEVGPKGFMYSRIGNPNRTALERLLAKMEAGAEAMAFSSGMAAAQAVFQGVLKPGDHVLISDDCYHGVVHLLTAQYPRWNVSFTGVDMTQVSNVAGAIRPETALILLETPSNPLLKIADISAIAKLAREKGITSVCDNTWATPYNTQPLELGVDLVFHSTTKYFGGHSDILGGCVVSKLSDERCARIRDYQFCGGAVPSPFDCWLLLRSMATMPLRIRQQTESAAIIASALAGHPKVEQVYYPGLKSHVNHDVARIQMKNGFGAMLSIQVKCKQADAMKFAASLKIFKHATSLGGVESLVEHRLTAEGIHAKSPENLMRISVGIEGTDDLLNDLLQALS
jgi:cystathionine gamma-synthase